MQRQVKIDPAARTNCAEALSSLIDGELDESACRELVERLCGDEQARRDWALLNVACDALRSSEVAALHSADFVARVSAALAHEPAIVARRPRLTHPGRTLRRIVLPAGAAAAAAVLVVLVGVPQLRTQEGQGSLKMVAAPGRDAAAVPVVVSTPVPRVSPDMVRSAELEAYLEAHRERSMGPLAPRANDYLRTNATLASEPR